MTEENPSYKSIAGANWRTGDILANEFGTGMIVDWRPKTWNSACFILWISKKLNLAWFNREPIKRHKNISKNKFRNKAIETVTGSDENLAFMGFPTMNGQYSHSMFGAMTDINIWNRSLSKTEVEQWSRCELEAGGNLVDWNTAQWEAVGLKRIHLEKQEVCGKLKATKHLRAFHTKKTFDETLKHCRAAGGEMAVARDRNTMKLMTQQNQHLKDNCGFRFYSGYKEENDVWLDAITGEVLKWTHGCASFHVEYGEFDAITCRLYHQQYCPLCLVTELSAFHLQGICHKSFIDRFYTLQSPTQLLGYMQHQIIWSEENRRWEIINLITKRTEAFMNDTSDFPFATKHWYFIDGSNCVDLGQNWRSLNLHLKVPQPGNYCCGD